MKIWLATAKIEEIREVSWAPIAGVITNPTVLLDAGSDWRSTIRTLAGYRIPGHPRSSLEVHIQAISRKFEEIMGEMDEYSQLLSPKLLIPKVPIGSGGLAATAELKRRGFDVNVTALCSLPQVQMALNAGASYVSMYVARMNDASENGLAGYQLVEHTRSYIERNGFDAEIMAASVRTPEQYAEVIRLGAHAVAAPPKLLTDAVYHELSAKSLDAFEHAWKEAAR